MTADEGGDAGSRESVLGRFRKQVSAEQTAVFWPSFWLGVTLVAIKGYYLRERAADSPAEISSFLFSLAAISHLDVAYAIVLGTVHRATMFAARHRRPLRLALHAGFCAAYLMSAVYAVVDLEIFAFFMSPLTYPLMSLAGDLQSFATSIAPSLTITLLLTGIGSLVVFVEVIALCDALAPSVPRAARGTLAAALVLFVLGWVAVGHYELVESWSGRFDRRIAENPHWTFLSSAATVAIGESQLAFGDPVREQDLDDFLTVADRGGASTSPGPVRHVSLAANFLPRHGRIRNVILLVLESVSARSLELYGSAYKATPNLLAESKHALVFSNYYAPAGRSSEALAALLLSVHPRMSWRDVTTDFPQLRGTSLAEILKERNYRTGFVTSSDLSWAGWRDFLTDRGFDSTLQGSDLECGPPLTSWGVEDRCMIEGMLRWISEDPSRPFFLMGWTVQTHHPYEPTPGRPLLDFFGGKQPTDAYDLNRYLNVLHETDRQLGRFFAALRRQHLDEDTLVVIVGDHGEAFGDPHEYFGHGTALYEENVHVPLMLWSPKLFAHGARSPVIGSHVDLNQTIGDILGIVPAGTWQGRSLFDPDRSGRAYFFAANDNYQMGVREQGWKYLFDATSGREELYDLRADAAERTNVAAANPEVCRRLRQRLAARAEADRRFFPPVREAAL